MNDFRKRVNEWIQKCQALVQARRPAHSLSIMEGDRWWRIVEERPDGRNVFGFIDAKGDAARGEHVGDIRRADGWKRPAKLKAHLGNIYDEHGGMEFMTAAGPRPPSKEIGGTKECKATKPGSGPVKATHGIAKNTRPPYLGVAVLARHDPSGPLTAENCYFRTAVNEEEAAQGIEVLVGADLRDRFLELERQGWIHLDDESRQKVMLLGNLRNGDSPNHAKRKES